AIGHAVDLADARADGGAEHDEIERRGDHRRGQALPQRALEARHLELVNGEDGVPVHRWCTRSMKMSSSELCRVCRSVNAMFSSPSRRSSAGIPACASWASKLYSISLPPDFNLMGH